MQCQPAWAWGPICSSSHRTALPSSSALSVKGSPDLGTVAPRPATATTAAAPLLVASDALYSLNVAAAWRQGLTLMLSGSCVAGMAATRCVSRSETANGRFSALRIVSASAGGSSRRSAGSGSSCGQKKSNHQDTNARSSQGKTKLQLRIALASAGGSSRRSVSGPSCSSLNMCRCCDMEPEIGVGLRRQQQRPQLPVIL